LQKWYNVPEYISAKRPKIIVFQKFTPLIFIPDRHAKSIMVIRNNSSIRYRQNTLPNMEPEKYDTK